MLKELSKVPKSINVLGELPSQPVVAIVGTRRCSAYGKQVTYQLARDLAEAGIAIISGLAAGIDGVAHQAALDAGGTTIAVLGHGLDQIYPRHHRQLAEDILRHGGSIISEYELGEPPLPFHFVERNRIIAALAKAVIVTEAGVKSGALLTVRDANNLGKSIMAVPGNITSPASAGPNNLIRSGALAVTSATDVMAELGFINREAKPVPAKSPQEAMILRLLGGATATADTLIEASGLSAAEFANIISLMEITGKVRNLGAGLWVAR